MSIYPSIAGKRQLVMLDAVQIHFRQVRALKPFAGMADALRDSVAIVNACRICWRCAAGQVHHDGRNGAGRMLWDLHVEDTPDGGGVYLFECDAAHIWEGIVDPTNTI